MTQVFDTPTPGEAWTEPYPDEITEYVRASNFAPDPLFDTAVLYVDAAAGAALNRGTAALDVEGHPVDPAVEKAGLYGAAEAQRSTTPDDVRFDLTDGYVIAVDLAAPWVKPAPSSIVAKPQDGGTVQGETEDCFAVGIGVDGVPYIEWHDEVGGHNAPSFTVGQGATADVELGDGAPRRQLVWEFIADNGEGGWTARLYDGDPADPTLLSEIVNTEDGAQTIVTSEEPLIVGDFAYGAVYRARLYGTLGGTLLADFHPDRDHESGTTMTSGSTGEEWSNVPVPAAPAFGYLTVADNPALDVAADADATFAFWFTTGLLADTDGEIYIYANRESGTLGQNGNGLTVRDAKIDAFFVDFFGAIVGDGADQATAVSNTGWAAGARLVVVTIDRATDTLTAYRDGVEHATGDLTDVGAIDPAADLILAAAAHHAVAKWDEVLDPADIAAAR